MSVPPTLPLHNQLFFVGHIPRATSAAELRAAFAVVGFVAGFIEFVVDRVTGSRRGFAFVDLRVAFDSESNRPGASTLARLRCATLDGQALDVQLVPSVKPRSPLASPDADRVLKLQ